MLPRWRDNLCKTSDGNCSRSGNSRILHGAGLNVSRSDLKNNRVKAGGIDNFETVFFIHRILFRSDVTVFEQTLFSAGGFWWRLHDNRGPHE
jgi:hypothetical protein